VTTTFSQNLFANTFATWKNILKKVSELHTKRMLKRLLRAMGNVFSFNGNKLPRHIYYFWNIFAKYVVGISL